MNKLVRLASLFIILTAIGLSPISSSRNSSNIEEEVTLLDTGGVRRYDPSIPSDFFFMQRASRRTGTVDFQLRKEAIQRMRERRGRHNRQPLSAPGETQGLDAPSGTQDIDAPSDTQMLAEPSDVQMLTAQAGTSWQLRGPTNIGGRITDIVGDRTNANKFYAATATGGIWKTTNGSTFTQIFDGFGSPSIGGLALDPNNSDILYVGTGEGNPNANPYPGDGVWKTTDGGLSWQHLGLEATNSIGRVAIDPKRPSIVFVAAVGNLYSRNVDRGLYRTKDGGATWQKVLYVSDVAGVIDVAIDPVNTDRIYAVSWERIRYPNTRDYGGPGSGIWRSINGGDTWTQLTSGLPASSTEPGRIGIAVAPSSPSTIYAIYSDATGNFTGLYKSTNGGDTWAKQSATGLSGSGFYSTYGWWFGRLWVHPTNANEVWADGVGLYKSTNGGSSFTSVGGSMHVDHHAQWFYPASPSTIIKGNDGGVYKSTNGGSSWTKLNTLPITQFYAIEVDLRNPSRLFGGAQDNGTSRTTTGQTSDWSMIYGGDGFVVNVDPTNSNIIYAESQNGGLGKSTDGGATFSSATSGITGRKNWNTPVFIDPSSTGTGSTTTLYYGAERLFRSTNSAGSWTAISGDLSKGDPGSNLTYGTISTIAVAKSNRNTIYVGTDDGNVWVTKNVGNTWTKITTGLPDRWVTRVAVDPNNDAIAYATFSGLNRDERDAHVFRTTNYGTSWTNISSNLPDVPVNDVVIDPTNTATLYVATDVGVFVSYNTGGSWDTLGVGLPEVIVMDLKYVPGTPAKLYAGTFGRSMYSFDLASTSPTPTPVTPTPTPTPVTPTPTPTATPISTVVFSDDFEANKGWTVNPSGSDTATSGQWERGDPEGTSDTGGAKQLGTTTSGVNDLVTGRLAGTSVGAYDLDAGRTSIRSPNIVMPSSGNLTLTLKYYLAHANNSSSADYLRVKIVGNTTTTVFEKLGAAANVNGSWQTATANLSSYAGQTIYILIEAADVDPASLLETAVDDVSISAN